jgi:hypothetical protein
MTPPLAAALVALLVAPPLAAQPPSPETADLKAGVRQVEDGDLEAAVPTLQRAIERLTPLPGRERDRITAHLYLGMAQLGLGNLEAARKAIHEAWRLNRGARLDARKYPPGVLALYAEAGRQRTVASGASPAGKDTPEKKSKTVPFLAGLGVGVGAAVTAHALSGGGPTPATPPSSQSALGSSSIRLYNCDDIGRASLNGVPIVEIGLGQDTGRIDLTRALQPGPNELVFELYNDHGPITYGFEVRRADAIVFQETCGIVNQAGCENGRSFERGVVRRFTFILQGP